MYKNLNLSEMYTLKRNLYRLENLYNLKNFFKEHDLNNLLEEHNEEILFDALNEFECHDIKELNCILSNEDIHKVIKFINDSYKEAFKSNDTKKFISYLISNILFFNSINQYDNNCFDFNSLFDSLCETFKIPENLKESLIHLTQGFYYQQKVYNDPDEDLIDEYFDYCPFGLDLITVVERLAAHFNVTCIGISKDELGTEGFFSDGYDKYFQSDFEDVKDCLTFTEEGYVEEGSYFDSFQSDDYILYIDKDISELTLDFLENIAPKYSPYHQYVEFSTLKQSDNTVKIFFNDGAVFPGVSVMFLVLLILIMVEEV